MRQLLEAVGLPVVCIKWKAFMAKATIEKTSGRAPQAATEHCSNTGIEICAHV